LSIEATIRTIWKLQSQICRKVFAGKPFGWKDFQQVTARQEVENKKFSIFSFTLLPD